MNPLNDIIMDGNGRWGLKFKSRNAGHKAGLKTVERSLKRLLKIILVFNFICFLYRKLEKTKRNKLFI